MVKVLLALDSFKGSMDAFSVCKTIAGELDDGYEVVILPMADGGEGTVDAIVNARNGEYVVVDTVDHLGRMIKASYGLFEKTAVIEASSTCGLNLVAPRDRNIMVSNSYGLGELVLSAIDRGVERFIIAIGGTGTNDGGYGLGLALGYRFLDANGNDLPNTPDALIKLEKIIPPSINFSVFDFTIACDVKNKLFGENGASFVYGAQKGGTKDQLDHLDACLKNLSRVIEKDLGINIADLEGSGAGGGLAAGFVAFCGGQLKSGYSIVAEATDIESIIKDVDVVVTGEGKTDSQTLFGKLPFGVINSAKKYNKFSALVSGYITDEGKCGMEKIGCDAFFPCVDNNTPMCEAIKNSRSNLINASKKLNSWLNSLDI